MGVGMGRPTRQSRSGARVIAGTLCLVVALAPMLPATANAAPPETAGDPSPAATSGGEIDKAKSLYADGQAHFDLFHYEKAVELWTAAYAAVPDDAPWVKNRMVYNIATAQLKAFEMDHELIHLRQASRLLQTYVDNYTSMYDETPETRAEVAKAKQRIAELQAQIEAAEAGQPVEPVAPQAEGDKPAHYGGGEINGIDWETGYVPPLNKELLAENRRLAAEEGKTDKMIVAGYAVGAVGLFFLIVGAGGVGSAARASSTGAAAGRGVGYGGFGLGIAGVTVGATLLGVGLSRRKKARERSLSFAPTFGPRQAGLSVGGRF